MRRRCAVSEVGRSPQKVCEQGHVAASCHVTVGIHVTPTTITSRVTAMTDEGLQVSLTLSKQVRSDGTEVANREPGGAGVEQAGFSFCWDRIVNLGLLTSKNQ